MSCALFRTYWRSLPVPFGIIVAFTKIMIFLTLRTLGWLAKFAFFQYRSDFQNYGINFMVFTHLLNACFVIIFQRPLTCFLVCEISSGAGRSEARSSTRGLSRWMAARAESISLMERSSFGSPWVRRNLDPFLARVSDSCEKKWKKNHWIKPHHFFLFFVQCSRFKNYFYVVYKT